MSIIHDALKRVEQKGGRTPVAELEPNEPKVAPTGSRRQVVLLSLGMVAAIGGYYWFGTGPEPFGQDSPMERVAAPMQKDVADGLIRVAQAESPGKEQVEALTTPEVPQGQPELDQPVGHTAGPLATGDVSEEQVSRLTEAVPTTPEPGPPSERQPDTEAESLTVENLTEMAPVDRRPPAGGVRADQEDVEELTQDAEPSDSTSALTASDAPETGSSDGSVRGAANEESPEMLFQDDTAERGGKNRSADVPAAATPVASAGKAPERPVPAEGPPGGDKKSAEQRPAVDLPTLLAQTLAQERSGDLAGARRGYQTLLRAQSNHYTARLGLARTSAKLGNFRDALTQLESLGPEPGGWEYWFWRGYAKLKLNNAGEALVDLQRAVAQNPDDLSLMLHQVTALQKLARHQEAIDVLHRARSQAPAMPEIAFSAGVSWWALGDRPRAAAAFSDFTDMVRGREAEYGQYLRLIRETYRLR